MKITGVLPVFNGQLFIDRSLPVILDTLKKDDELVIVNNGSSDLSLDILSEWAATDSRIKLITTKKANLVQALNIGIDVSQNEWIARFDIDDLYSKHRLDFQTKSISDKTVAVFSDYEFINSVGEFLGSIPSAIFPTAVSTSLISSQRTAHPSVLFLKQAVESVGGYREEDFPAEDLSLWLRLSRVGQLISVPHSLLKYRLSPGSISYLNRNTIKLKAQFLYQNIGLNMTDLQDAINNSETILEFYDSFSENELRKILFIKELNNFRHSPIPLSNDNSRKIKKITHKFLPRMLGDFHNYHNYVKFLKQKQKRNKYRNQI